MRAQKHQPSQPRPELSVDLQNNKLNKLLFQVYKFWICLEEIYTALKRH